MQEKITSIDIAGPGETVSGRRVSFSAYTTNPIHRNKLDGRITKMTGLESTDVEVAGGPVSYGGSVYTGVRPTDREVVITVKPSGMSSSELKSSLNALISRSLAAPLLLRVNTKFENGEDSYVQGDCYITSVSSPIFESDNKVQITLKLAKPHLEREEVRYVYPNHNNFTVYRDVLVLYRMIHVRLDNDLDSGAHYINAPSPMMVLGTLDGNAAKHMMSMVFRDSNDNMVNLMTPELYSNAGVNQDADLEFNFNTHTREIGAALMPGNFNLKDADGYIQTINPGWPMLGPDSTDSWLYFTFKNDYKGSLEDDLLIRNYTIWPRVFGI